MDLFWVAHSFGAAMHIWFMIRSIWLCYIWFKSKSDIHLHNDYFKHHLFVVTDIVEVISDDNYLIDPVTRMFSKKINETAKYSVVQTFLFLVHHFKHHRLIIASPFLFLVQKPNLDLQLERMFGFLQCSSDLRLIFHLSWFCCSPCPRIFSLLQSLPWSNAFPVQFATLILTFRDVIWMWYLEKNLDSALI